MANPYTAYIESQVLLASPLELVHLAYQKTIDWLSEARGHLAENRVVPQMQTITRVQGVIIHLQASLDYEKGGDLSRQLSALYDYILRRLNEGNRDQSDAAFAEVQQLLKTVGEAWKQLASGETSEVAVAATVSSNSPWMAENNTPWMSSDASVYTRTGYSL